MVTYCVTKIIAEPGRPEGPPSGAPYSNTYRKVTDLWVDFLMVIMASGIARGRVRTTTTESRNMAAILQIIGCQRHTALVCRVLGHPYYDQLTPVKTEYPLTSITWLYRRLKFITHGRHMFFWSWPLTTSWFSDWIAGSCQVNLLEAGQDCSEAGLKIESQLNYNFFFCRNVFCCFCLRIWWLLKLKTEAQTLYRKPHRNVTKLKSKFYLFLG